MAALTRRRSNNAHAESWQIFYGDVQVGTIGIRAGVPTDVDQWGWSCGFHPLKPVDGTAAEFESARRNLRPPGKSICRNAPRRTLTTAGASAHGRLGNTRC
jgi:hypothetical protein